MEVVKVTGKRQRRGSALVSPPPSPRLATPATAVKAKRRRLEACTDTDTKQREAPRAKVETKKAQASRKRRHSVVVDEEKTASATEGKKDTEEEKPTSKKRRVDETRSSSSPPPSLPATPLAKLSEKHASTALTQAQSAQEEDEDEKKARVPLSPIVIPPLALDHDDAAIPTETRRDGATYTNLEEYTISSQGSDADLVAACANLQQENVRCSHDAAHREVQQRLSLRSIQVTPPPSERMLDRKNPPPPPKRPKPRPYRRIVYARTYPRLPLSPLSDNTSPPSSPRVFRSLETEFAVVMQDTPEIRPRVRPAPRMARGTRRSTRAGNARAQRSLDTPTSTMVLRSRQLNPNATEGDSGGKPENEREREQRNAVRRQ
ncbi:hypothetical protein PsorP6_012596 [Peronosclerospora sorghi]|uniref:Uncharacterized protein n=1 Tax=Peronosclerospora sorghi TaxID=230839 RepID=A0ACC0WGX1_9STRA|nr:hypothetical protein PsorP6_012596 [Peronosclerospora sorghi]